jgi:hypothetical protein
MVACATLAALRLVPSILRLSSGNERKRPRLLTVEGSFLPTLEEDLMKYFAIAVLAGAGGLFAQSANAADFYTTSEYTSPEQVQQVRLVCNESGRCYQTRSERRVIIHDDSYAYAPRDRYIEHRYRDRYDGPDAGVRFRAPGVSVGVGVDNDRW